MLMAEYPEVSVDIIFVFFDKISNDHSFVLPSNKVFSSNNSKLNEDKLLGSLALLYITVAELFFNSTIIVLNCWLVALA